MYLDLHLNLGVLVGASWCQIVSGRDLPLALQADLPPQPAI